MIPAWNLVGVLIFALICWFALLWSIKLTNFLLEKIVIFICNKPE